MLSAAGSNEPDVTDLLRNLVRSRLFDPRVVEKLLAIAQTPPNSPPTDFLNYLVERQELTQFQAQSLARGNWQGLRVGPYRLLYPIARGGMGSVYLADGGRTQVGVARKLVALKILPPKRAKEVPRMLTRFQREIDISNQLPVHPHLMRTLDSGLEAGVYYLALEYLTGKTVRQVVVENGTLPIGQAARIFCDVASGLHQFHIAGFVHRDLKPGNVVVAPDGRAKLLDFGFALIHGETPPTDPTIIGGKGYTVGTMDYLAPEQAQDASCVGPSADLYSLGCSLYFALTGTAPFPEKTTQDKIRAHRTKYPPDLTTMNPTIPAEFSRLVQWFLAKRPDQRPKSAAEVVQHLEPWADPVSPSPNNPPWNRPAAVLREVEARWLATRSPSNENSESLIEPVLPQSGIRLPWWVVGLLALSLSFALIVLFFLGYVVAFTVRR